MFDWLKRKYRQFQNSESTPARVIKKTGSVTREAIWALFRAADGALAPASAILYWKFGFGALQPDDTPPGAPTNGHLTPEIETAATGMGLSALIKLALLYYQRFKKDKVSKVLQRARTELSNSLQDLLERSTTIMKAKIKAQELVDLGEKATKEQIDTFILTQTVLPSYPLNIPNIALPSAELVAFYTRSRLERIFQSAYSFLDGTVVAVFVPLVISAAFQNFNVLDFSEDIFIGIGIAGVFAGIYNTQKSYKAMVAGDDAINNLFAEIVTTQQLCDKQLAELKTLKKQIIQIQDHFLQKASSGAKTAFNSMKSNAEFLINRQQQSTYLPDGIDDKDDEKALNTSDNNNNDKDTAQLLPRPKPVTEMTPTSNSKQGKDRDKQTNGENSNSKNPYGTFPSTNRNSSAL